MKNPRKYWPYPILLIFLVILNAGYLALAQEEEDEQQRQQESVVQTQEQSSDPSESAIGQVKGTPGVAIKSAEVNVRELVARQGLIPAPYKGLKEIREPGPGPLRNLPVPSNAVVHQESAATDSFNESDAPSVASPTPSASFKALEDNGTSIPPDTHGAVGLNHLMVATNTQIRYLNKSGGTLLTVDLDLFWSNLGDPDVFDPKVIYDKFNNRWIFVCTADATDAASSLLLAISVNGDPTGNWRIYKVDADANNVVWADYPSVGVNKNWVVITLNMFQIGGSGSFVREDVFVFDKTKLYAATPSAIYHRFPDATVFTGAPAVTYDNTINTLYIVEHWQSNSGGNGILRLSTVTGTPSAPVYTKGTSFASTPNPWNYGNIPEFAQQLGSTRKIATGDARMLKTVYRNGSLWCVHHVFLPATNPTHTAVQWWRLSPTGVIQQRGRIEKETAPLTFYAYPSIAVNKNDDVLIGYSRFSSQQYASANYSFRAGTDAPNTLRSDAVLKAGSAPYAKGSTNRWGDYSNTEVDPTNDVDLWTIQEHAAPVSFGDSYWGTWWGRINPPASTATPNLQLGTVTPKDGGADPDTIIEPGESNNTLTVQVKNVGGAAATAVSGKLTTSTPGVTITTNTSGYPNLAATSGTGTNTTPFKFNVASTVPCGSNISFTLTMTYTGGGSPKALPLSVRVGTVGAAVAKAYTGAVKAIPDNNTTGVTASIAVSGFTGRISDLNFKFGGTSCTSAAGATTVGLDHTYVGDLVATLKSPAGTVVTLMNRPGGGINNGGNNFCNTVLDDEASALIQNITAAQNPYVGSFKPNAALSAFDGQNPNGTWVLTVSDRVGGDTGSVRAFSLIITASQCSTTSLAAPFEVRSDRALASLSNDGNPTDTSSGTEATFTATRQNGLSAEQYLRALFASSQAQPIQIAGELFRSTLMASADDDLIRLLTGT